MDKEELRVQIRQILREEGAIQLPEDVRKRIAEVMERYGVNPGDVPVDEWGDWGYRTVQTRPDGTWLTVDGTLQLVDHQWPEGCWEEILEVWK